MTNFPDHITDMVNFLREVYRRRRIYVIEAYPILEIIREEKRRKISFKFFYNPSDDTFEMQIPDNEYFSSISHFEYDRAERRHVRDKVVIIMLIKDLKRSGLWEKISNKDLIVVNDRNKKSDKSKLRSLLDSLKD